MLKQYIEFNTLEAEKNGDRDQKGLYTLVNNAAYSKVIQNLRNRIDVKLGNNEKVKNTLKIYIKYLKSTLKLSCMSHKTFHNNIVAIRKIKVSMELKKPADIGMCVLQLNKLMFDLHYDYIKNICQKFKTIIQKHW